MMFYKKYHRCSRGAFLKVLENAHRRAWLYVCAASDESDVRSDAKDARESGARRQSCCGSRQARAVFCPDADRGPAIREPGAFTHRSGFIQGNDGRFRPRSRRLAATSPGGSGDLGKPGGRQIESGLELLKVLAHGLIRGLSVLALECGDDRAMVVIRAD